MTKNISGIITMFSSMDKSGASVDKIDTYLEYYKLGEYLNGQSSIDGIEQTYSELDKSEQNKLIQIYNKAKKYINNTFFTKGNEIKLTKENISEYQKIYDDLDWKSNNNELSKDEQKIYDILGKSLYNYCINEQYDLSDLEYNEVNYRFVLSEITRRDRIEAEMIEKGKVVLDRLENPYDNNLLKAAVEKRIVDENIQVLNPDNYDIDLGNGEYDKPATQETELCWAHSGINVLDLTEEGKILLNSNKYYDKRTGVFAIHLQEAEDNGLHGGIYVITPDELEMEGKSLSSGEGDVTAWMVAIKRYFDEMQQNPELMEKADKKGQLIMDVNEGNFQFRFFEIITGAQPNRKNLWNLARLQIGVSYGKNDITFDDISDLVSNKKGAAVICLGGHNMSVVGIRGDKLLIQESNNLEDFDKTIYDEENNHILFEKTEPINGKPTYELTKYDFEHYNFGEGVIKWK